MASNATSSHFLQEMAYPPYCLQTLQSWGMVAVGGGGGTAKTGVSNAVDLKWIYLNQSPDPDDNRCSVHNVNSFTQNDSVMRMVSLRKQNEYLILALNRHLKVIMLKPSATDNESATASGHLNGHEPTPTLTLPRTVRRRHNSSTSSTTDGSGLHHRLSTMIHRPGQATVEAFGNDTVGAQSPSTHRTLSFSFPPGSPTTAANHNVYTVPIQEHDYVNALVVCPATQSKLFVGANDGSLTIYEIIWPPTPSSSDRLLHLNQLASFRAHEKEIDDLAVDSLGTWLVSASRDFRVRIRQCSPPFDQHGELDLMQFGKTKGKSSPRPIYRIRHVRFGIVPSSSSINASSILYTSLIPQSTSDRIDSSIIQWTENKQRQFVVRRRQSVSSGRISALAVSDCGQYVSVGDSDGCVRIYESERLKLLYQHRAHSIFVTDLAFILRKENYLHETSVLSISADKNLYVHNVHPAQTNLFSVSVFIVMGLLLLFLLLSQIRFRFH